MNCKSCENCKMVYRRDHYMICKVMFYYCTKNEMVLVDNKINEKCNHWCKKCSAAIDLSNERFKQIKKEIISMFGYLKEFF